MNLRDLENLIASMAADPNLMSNMQHSASMGSSLNLIRAVGNLSMAVFSDMSNDTCKNLMTQKVFDLENYTAQAILMRFTEDGLDIARMAGGIAPQMFAPPMPQFQMPSMLPGMQMPQQFAAPPPMYQQMPQYAPPPPMPQYQQPAPPPPMVAPTPVQPMAAAPVASPPMPAAPPQAAAAPAPAPVSAPMPTSAPSEKSGGGSMMGVNLPGLGGGSSSEPAAGRDYLLSIINGEA